MIARTKDMIAGTVLVPDITRRPTVSTTYLRGVVTFAEGRGISRRALLQHAGVAESDLDHHEARHPLLWLILLLRAGAEIEGDPAFALRFGQHVPCDQVSLAAPMGRAATNVVEALRQVNRYAPLSIDFPSMDGGDRYQFDTDHAGLWLHDRRPMDAWPEITELVFARMVQGIRRIQHADVVRAVHVTHAAPAIPAHRAAYDLAFDVPIHFGSARNALLLDPAYLHTELVPAPAHVTRILATHADAQLVALAQQRSCRGRLESALRQVLHSGDVGVTAMARLLAMSRQTLYRRLKDEGVTFEQVLESLRREIALEALRTGTTSVRDVATRVGFSDPAAFSRAFKRWTGRSPSQVSATAHATA